MPQNIFVLGLDELNRESLEALPGAGDHRFHQLLSIEELQQGDEIPLRDLVEKAESQLESFEGTVDAVVGYWDFPVSSMVPILSRRFGLRSATLESVVKCEHKYWSRREQSEVIDEYPRFALVDLEEPDVAPPEELDFPFWMKPVKSFSSELAYAVEDDASFHEALAAIRDGISRIGAPFEYVLEHLDLPEEIARIGGQACLAEESMAGSQVTVEGYSLDGEIRVYGAVDSVTYPDNPSFVRFQYPSRLPERVFERMADVARRLIAHLGLDAATFNIEFFWNEERDTVRVLEVNPRHSQSHAKLFEYVDGMPNHEAMVELALGREPRLPHREGGYSVAAKWFVRRFSDGVVRRSPTEEEIAALERELPGTTVHVVASTGDRLSELPDQDSYSYKLANCYIGAADEEELEAKFERCVEALPFEFGE